VSTSPDDRDSLGGKDSKRALPVFSFINATLSATSLRMVSAIALPSISLAPPAAAAGTA
jgi:hypothetical protein